TISWIVNDGDANSTTTTSTISINAVDDATEISGDTSVTGDEDTTLTGTLIAKDPDGLTSSSIFSIHTDPSNGSAAIGATNGEWRYIPINDFNGSDQFTVAITDDTSNSTNQDITLNINDVNDEPPQPTDDTFEVKENERERKNNRSSGLFSNDTDPDTPRDNFLITQIRTGRSGGSGNSGSLSTSLIGTYGTLTIHADGRFDYIADQDRADALADGERVEDTFTYTVSDNPARGSARNSRASIIFSITGENDAPVADDDSYTVSALGRKSKDTRSRGLFSNDTDLDTDASNFLVTEIRTGRKNDPDGRAGSVGSPLVGNYGTLTLQSDGTFIYDADQPAAVALSAGQVAEEIFTYTLSDNLQNNSALNRKRKSKSTHHQPSKRVTDPSLSDSASLTFTIDGINDSPILSGGGRILNYTENSGDVRIEPELTIADPDDNNIESASIQISSNFLNSEDTLEFTDANGISGSWDSSRGTLSLSGSASLADYQSALESISYTNSSDNPSSSDRIITWSVNDGDDDSSNSNSTIVLTTVDDIAVISGDRSASGDEDTTVTGRLRATDPEGLTSASIFSIARNPVVAIATINAQSGAWTYTPTDNFFGSDSFDVSITDDLGGITTQTITLNINGVNDAPSIRITSTNNFTEDSNAARGDVVASFTTSDLDGDTVRVSLSDTTHYAQSGNNITLKSAGAGLINNGTNLPYFTLTPNDGISDGLSININPATTTSNDEPTLSVNDLFDFTEDSDTAVGDIVASFTTSDQNGDSVRISLSDTTNYAISGNSITLTAAGLILVNNGLDLPEFTLTPNDGISDGSTISIDPSVSASNDAPILTGAVSTLSYTENDAVRTIDSSLSITDNDNTKIESAAIQIISGFVSSEDILGFSDTEKITGSWDSKIGSLYLSGSASLAQYENALESIIYANSSNNPSNTNRTISWTINDGESESTQITSTITVQKINDAPDLSNLLISVDETISS
ncbi:MAG: Ig-like domain-containing protein, partial [Prochlorococcus sp.]